MADGLIARAGAADGEAKPSAAPTSGELGAEEPLAEWELAVLEGKASDDAAAQAPDAPAAEAQAPTRPSRPPRPSRPRRPRARRPTAAPTEANGTAADQANGTAPEQDEAPAPEPEAAGVSAGSGESHEA